MDPNRRLNDIANLLAEVTKLRETCRILFNRCRSAWSDDNLCESCTLCEECERMEDKEGR